MQKHYVKDFDILSQIGKGTYARVVLVRYKINHKTYAMKVINKQYIIQRKQSHSIMRQRDILAQIQHPFLTKMYFSFQDTQNLYLVLQYCPGGQFFNLLSLVDRFTQDQAKFYSAQIILALEQLHRHNIVYRDIKPENVLIDADGYVKLTDFGLSKVLEEKDSFTWSFCGTPQYLAPQIVKKAGHGIDVDWWGLGCLIYEMVRGNPPFRNKNRPELMKSILQNQIDLTSRKLSSDLKDLLTRLLQKDYTKRLGHNGVLQIKTHPWFKSINWKTLRKKHIKAPFIPRLKHETDTINFDSQFTSESLQDLFRNNRIESQSKDGNFKNFQFSRDDLLKSK